MESPDVEPNTAESEDTNEPEPESIQKPARKGRPPLSAKQKEALALGRLKSRKNMALAMTKAKLARLQEEKPEPTEDDDDHVEQQRARYRSRLELLASVLSDWSGEPVGLPDGAFYLWIPVTDGWEYTERLARDGGALVSPGEFYGADGTPFVRVAVVQPDDRIQLVADRLAAARG